MANPTSNGVKLKWPAKVLIFGAIVATAFFSIKHFAPGLFGGKKSSVASAPSVPPKADLPTGNEPGGSASSVPPRASVATVAPPTSTRAGCSNLPEVRMWIWAWNAQQGLLFANGGLQSVENSLMCQNGVNLKLTHNDMTDEMTAALVACAAELGQGKTDCSNGTNFIAIMGDGGAAYFANAQKTVSSVCSDCKLEIVGSAGYSRGEDKFMGPPAWKQDPNAARGAFIAGVVRDGDWNIALKWAGDNGICNNPDETTYDANCLNWVNTPGYIEAAAAYNANTCEVRPVVSNGRRTGQSAKICVNGVVTWTPGDVNVAKGRGGLVSILSTKENIYQMPNVVIGIDKWDQAHRPQVVGFLKAMTDGGQQVKQSSAARTRAGEVSAIVYNDQDGAYWSKYFNVTTEKDSSGLAVELGGSSVNNLADNLYLFGMSDGAGGAGVGLDKSIFAATYKTFGNIVVHYYPDLVPRFPPVASIVDTSYLAALQASAPAVAQAELPTYAPALPGDAEKPLIGRLNWAIQFKTGSAEFDASALPVLDKIYGTTVQNNAKIDIVGHTDDVGDDTTNLALSRARAEAVKKYLQTLNPQAYPDNRFPLVTGRGELAPLDPAKTPAARAKNRRVEIVMREN